MGANRVNFDALACLARHTYRFEMLNLFAWLMAIIATVFFLFGIVGMFAPSFFKRPDEDKPPARWKFFLTAWFAPLLPGTIAITIWWLS